MSTGAPGLAGRGSRLFFSQPTLTDVTNPRANDEIVAALKGLTKANKPYVKCGAVVGLAAMQRILFEAVKTCSDRNLSAFETVKKAFAWPAQQA